MNDDEREWERSRVKAVWEMTIFAVRHIIGDGTPNNPIGEMVDFRTKNGFKIASIDACDIDNARRDDYF